MDLSASKSLRNEKGPGSLRGPLFTGMCSHLLKQTPQHPTESLSGRSPGNALAGFTLAYCVDIT